MKAPIITVFTNDNNLWLLQGFQYLFKKYWSPTQNVRVVGYAAPKNGVLSLPFSFVSIAKRNYPISEWSTGIIRSLEKFQENGEEFIIFMLEDYWLREPVDRETVKSLIEYIHKQPRNILRIDLTADRCQHRRFLTNHGRANNGSQLLRTSARAPYQVSFQAGIWNVDLLLHVLKPSENPWQAEIYGSRRIASHVGDKHYIVLGTRDYPVKYQPVYRSKRAAMDISKLPKEDQDVILKRGWI